MDVSADIIKLADRLQKNEPVHRRIFGPEPAVSASSDSSVIALGRLHSKTLFRLPFVTLPSEKTTNWREFWRAADFWNVAPSDDPAADRRRGRDYAWRAVQAIVRDDAEERDLEIVVERLVKKAMKRRGARGYLARSLSTVDEGFLHELCRMVVALARAHGMPAQRKSSNST
jgi:hypothetical protein